MKISREWLQRSFDAPLPDSDALADALTFHAFEIESVENDVLDVKVTANRGHDCLSHRGIAKELSAILKLPLKYDALATVPDLSQKTNAVSVRLDSELCIRYIAGYITNVKVGPSPEWLKKSLETIGQRSINNVVDATNYVMFSLGQPLHAFDAGKLSQKDGGFAINVRLAKDGERMVALDDKDYAFTAQDLLITDGNSTMPIGIAGIKGGAPSGIDDDTTDIIIESANFNGVAVRKSAARLKLRTDASSRFEQVISPELAAYAMCEVVKLIHELAGGTLEGYVDVYPEPQVERKLSVAFEKIQKLLGAALSAEAVADAFTRLGFSFEENDGTYTVTAPIERLDLVIPEDLVEEVGRIIGYDQVPETPLPAMPQTPHVNARFASMERVREELMAKGYSEVITSVFTEKGDRLVANKVDGVRPYLRKSLVEGLKDAYEKNNRIKDILGLKEVKLFEIGTIWKKGNEEMVVGTADKGGVKESPLEIREAGEYENLPVSTTERYQTFSRYPFIARDIALWVPLATSAADVLAVIRSHAGELVVRSEQFDEFKKDDRVSYAFRLIFQSFDKTLTDEDANERMESVYKAVKEKGWEVR